MDLSNKAQWHIDTNGGFIPLLECPGNGKLVFESAVIMNFACTYGEAGQGLDLWPHEAAPAGDVDASFETS